jgi:hypothetical protein
MDQTPIYFSVEPKSTLALKGSRTVNTRKLTSSTVRVTVAVAVTASGDTLPWLLVFKGEPGKTIEKQMQKDGDDCLLYYAQGKAWMSEFILHKWIDQVLAPWVATAPPGVVPYLLLDQYKCHLMKSVVNRIEDLGIEVEHIPPGATGLIQPVDVGINKPLKNYVMRHWENYMIDEGLNMTKTKPPTRFQFSQWIIASQNKLTKEIIKNAWRHSPFSYFPLEPSVHLRRSRSVEEALGTSSNDGDTNTNDGGIRDDIRDSIDDPIWLGNTSI